jgi:hypothetical protein
MIKKNNRKIYRTEVTTSPECKNLKLQYRNKVKEQEKEKEKYLKLFSDFEKAWNTYEAARDKYSIKRKIWFDSATHPESIKYKERYGNVSAIYDIVFIGETRRLITLWIKELENDPAALKIKVDKIHNRNTNIFGHPDKGGLIRDLRQLKDIEEISNKADDSMKKQEEVKKRIDDEVYNLLIEIKKLCGKT